MAQKRLRRKQTAGNQAARKRTAENQATRKRTAENQAARKRTVKRKTKKRRRKILKISLIVLVILALLVGRGYLSTLVFKLKQIKVTKNRYTVSEDVVNWIRKDPYSENTLYVWWKYNRTEPLALPAAESVKVKITSPWEVTVEIKEKTFTGCLTLGEEFIYFDEKGIASYKSPEVMEGVILVEGAEISAEEVQIGKVLPVSDSGIFEKICEITGLLEQNKLTPDKIAFAETDLVLWFGGVRIQVGSGSYEAKVEQIPPILEKLNELYPGQKGVLHLENYEQGTDSIRFVPEWFEQTEG